jgi:hypothetical protein
MMTDPIVLIRADDPDKKPLMYACAKCGHCTSPRIFACKDDLAHETAKRMASDCYNCRTHNVCSGCGAKCEKIYTACKKCRYAKIVAGAELVEIDDEDPCYALDGHFYSSAEEARENGEEYVFPCVMRHFNLEPFHVEELILQDHHDDADTNELVGYDELLAAIERFNKAQNNGSYDEDRKKVARLAIPMTTPKQDQALQGEAL